MKILAIAKSVLLKMALPLKQKKTRYRMIKKIPIQYLSIAILAVNVLQLVVALVALAILFKKG